MNNYEVALLIKGNRESCVFTLPELSSWLYAHIDGISRRAAYQRATRCIRSLPVELLNQRYFRLLFIPDGKGVATNVKKKKVVVEPSIPREIIDYLNEKAGTRYKGKPADLVSIKARMSPPENFTLEDFKTVIDKKVSEWKGTNIEKYLRPETLFSPKFESYLNQSGPSHKGKSDEMASYSFEKYLPGGG